MLSAMFSSFLQVTIWNHPVSQRDSLGVPHPTWWQDLIAQVRKAAIFHQVPLAGAEYEMVCRFVGLSVYIRYTMVQYTMVYRGIPIKLPFSISNGEIMINNPLNLIK